MLEIRSPNQSPSPPLKSQLGARGFSYAPFTSALSLPWLFPLLRGYLSQQLKITSPPTVELVLYDSKNSSSRTDPPGEGNHLTCLVAHGCRPVLAL